MTSILEDLGKQCLEKLIKKAVKEARFLFCFTCIAKEFEEERAKLQPERETLEQRIKEAKGRNKDITANVVSWKEEVDKLIQADTKTKKTCFFGLCPDCIWRYKRGKKLANDTEKIKGLIEKADKFGNIEVSRPPPGVERNSLQDYISFESRLSKYNELLDALKDDNNYITGLQGMGGTGKTTLAIKVGIELKESGQFTYAIVTTVSSTPDIKKIQDDIAGPLGLELKDINESDRPGKLWDRLRNGEKILLILDDVWDQNPLLTFDAIGIPKRDNRKGCRVLVTTRSKIMNFDKSIELELLSEDEAWNMFQWYADISKSSPKYVIDKGCKIAKECKQLPIAIVGIASSLKGQQNRVDEWDVTLKSLKKPVSMQDVDPDKVGIFKCLKVSYDNLKNEKAKKLFLLCSVFQEDEEVSIEDLTTISIGAGLFGEDYDTYDDARKDVTVAKNKLLDSCLLSKVRENFVKMHDLIRDVAQWIARKEIRGVNLSNKNQKSLIEKETNIKCLLFKGSYKDLYFCKFDASKLETLIVIENSEENYYMMEIPNSFFENIVKLRVLYLSSYGNYRSLSLTNSFQSLKNIRSMTVHNVDIGDISTLGNMQSLETLALVGCQINELPSEIEKLVKFKLLKLESCKIAMHNPFEVIKRCSSLEELYFVDSFNHFCKRCITLPELRRYHIRAGWYSIDDSVSKYVNFNGDYGYFTKGTLKYCMQTADVLLLTNINSEWKNLEHEIGTLKYCIENGFNVPVEPLLGDDSQLQCITDTEYKYCRKTTEDLRRTKFERDFGHLLAKIDELVKDEPGEHYISELQCHKDYEPKYCMEVQEILRRCQINSGWRNLMPEMVPIENGMNDLLELHLEDDTELKLLIDTKHIDSQVPNVFFSKLIVLKLKGMKKLEELCNGSIFLDSLNNLENLSIKECNIFQSLFKCSLNLCKLKELTLESCPTLVSVFDLTTTQSLVQLESLEISQCEKLENIFTDERRVDDKIEEIDDGDNDKKNSCNSMFSKLKVLKIFECPLLRSIFPFLSAQDLLLPKSIRIQSCDKLEYIFGQHQDVQLASLKELELNDLPNFIDIFPESYDIMPLSIKGSSNSISKAQTQLVPIKSNIFSWSHICCLRYKLRGPTSTEISLVSEGQPKDFSISLDHLWERAQCLSRLSHIMCKIKVITLVNLPRIKSVFILSVASGMLLETLTVESCDELKHIIVDIGDGSGNDNIVFPQLKELYVENCGKLEYIFGHIDDSDDHQNYNPHLPALKCLKLCRLPSLTGMCTKNYRTTFPPLAVLELINCTQFDIKSIGDFFVKEWSGNVEHFVALERLVVGNSNVESICCLNEVSERQMNLGLQNIELRTLPTMTCLFKGLKKSFSLKNLTMMIIVGCEKLEIIFSISIIMCLPQLHHIRIEDCKELKHIIEDDLENKKSSNFMVAKTVCFPKLKTLVVVTCHKLKNVFPISIYKELPELKVIIIVEAEKLEEIFVCEVDQEVNIPNLRYVAFLNLPSLSQTQRIHFQAVQNRSILRCQELSLTSAMREYDVLGYLIWEFLPDHEWFWGSAHDILRNLTLYQTGLASEHVLTSSQLASSPSENEPHVPVIDHKQKGIEITAEEGTTLKSSTHLKPASSSSDLLATSKHITTSQDQRTQNDQRYKLNACQDSMSGTQNDQDIQLPLKQQSVKSNFEDVDLGDSQETTQSNFEDVDLEDSHETTQTNNNQVSLNDDASKSEPSSSTTSPIASQIPSMPSKDFDLNLHMESLHRQFQEDSKGHGYGNENQNARTTKEFAAWVEAEAASWHALTSSKLEGSTLENTEAATFSTISETKNVPPIQLDVAPKQKEVGDGKTCIPSSSIVNTKLPAKKYDDIGDSHKTIEMEDINILIEEDPILALEKLLTGVQSFSIETLLQELKTFMESLSDLDHLVSNQESKKKLISLFHGLNLHQGLLPSDVKEYVEKVQNFFKDNIIKHATSQEVIEKHNQLLDSKTDLMNKLLSAKSSQTHIDDKTSTAKAKIQELSLQIDELRKKLADLENQRDDLNSVLNQCDVQMKKLKAECSKWAQQSEELLSALALSEVNAKEIERARTLAKEGFTNLKSLFPTF